MSAVYGLPTRWRLRMQITYYYIRFSHRHTDTHTQKHAHTHKYINGDQVFNPRSAGWSSDIFFWGGGRAKRSNKHLHSVLTISNIYAHTYTYLQANIYVQYTHTHTLWPYIRIRLAWKTFFWQGESERPSIIRAKRALYVRSTSRCVAAALSSLRWSQVLTRPLYVRSACATPTKTLTTELMKTTRQMNDISEFDKQ